MRLRLLMMYVMLRMMMYITNARTMPMIMPVLIPGFVGGMAMDVKNKLSPVMSHINASHIKPN